MNLAFQHNLPVVANVNFASYFQPIVSRSHSHDAAATLVHAFVTSRLDDWFMLAYLRRAYSPIIHVIAAGVYL